MASAEGGGAGAQMGTHHNNNGAPESHYFFEDEVFKIDKRGRVKFGVIIGSGELISDEEDEDYVDPGKVRIAWHPDGKESVHPSNQLGLADRTLAPGDVVRRLDANGQPKQLGYCQEVTVCADVNVVGTNYVIKQVPAKRCEPLFRMPTGNAVYLDSWIGVSGIIKEKLVLQTSCGSLIEVQLCAENSPLWDIEDNPRGSFFSTPTFHPGQILVGPVASLENATWLYTSPEMKGSRKNKTVNRKFIVQSVELDEVTVHWQMKPCLQDMNTSSDELSFTEPPMVLKGDDLKRMRRMNVFDSSLLQINDKNYVTVTETDQVVTKSEWKKELANKYQILRERSAAAAEANKNLLPRSPKRSPGGCVKVVVSADGAEMQATAGGGGGEKKSKVQRQSLRPNGGLPKRGQSLKLEEENSPQYLTVNESRRSRSLDTNDGTESDEETSASGSDFSSNNTMSSCSNGTTPRSSPKCSPMMAMKFRKWPHRRKRRSEREPPPKRPETGQTVVTRSLVVYSTVTVLWQNGSLEVDVPSKELFPIHTLDHHEFFPGDFVLRSTSDADQPEEHHHQYGVIQTMDHIGRLARVKWFQKSAECGKDSQEPQYKGETEVSVYDLKDHLHFQYRPGTIVVRLTCRSVKVGGIGGQEPEANIEDEILGQVIDNSPEGKVKVMWINGNVSSCWPQDIFEVGNYDSGMFISHDQLNFGELDNDESWLTESEESHLGDEGNKVTPADRQFLRDSLERLKVSIARLRVLFKQNPQILSPYVVHELMVIYKKCRYLDRLMNTQFFHEENFEGLVERVRKTAMSAICGTGDGVAVVEGGGGGATGNTLAPPPVEKISADGFVIASHSTPKKGMEMMDPRSPVTPMNLALDGGAGDRSKLTRVILKFQSATEGAQQLYEAVMSNSNSATSIGRGGGEGVKPLSPPDGDGVTIITDSLKDTMDIPEHNKQSIKKGDSGHYSEMDEDESSSSAKHPSNATTDGVGMNHSTSNGSILMQELSKSGGQQPLPIELMCSKFCNLLKEQLIKAFHEINTLYCNLHSEWEVVKEEAATATGGDDSVQSKLEDSTELDELNRTASGDVGDEENGVPGAPPDSFLVEDTLPATHNYYLSLLNPKVPMKFYRAVKREHDMLRSGLPEGVWVRAYEERLDLFSVMIEGPTKTPYEDGVFMFDIQLGDGYPEEPPNCHYISYCHDRLNPNLYEEGRVCVSLLGTWSGKGTEKWGTNSSLLQLIVSIQGLILVAEPYYNEAGYEKQVGTQQGCENSQIYNEMVVIKLLQSMMKLLESPPEIFRERILNHFRKRGLSMIERISGWVALSRQNGEIVEGEVKQQQQIKDGNMGVPEFPLVPASRGFCITVEALLGRFKHVIEGLGL